ncbi:MAG: hypothetical protein H6550_06020 [Chitinophagales bacterium]|nr:hypothetical protein [Chitinophagales bacterium]
MNYLKIFMAILVLLPSASFAESNDNPITCKFGKYTYESTEKASYEITIPELEKDAHLYIYSKDKKYTITKYAIGVVSKSSRDLKGEFIKSDNDIVEALKSEDITVAVGDRIFITDIQAICDGCKTPVDIKPMVILVK